jgi:hypothetical protein
VDIREGPASSISCSLSVAETRFLGDRRLPDCEEAEYLDWTILPIPKTSHGIQFCNQFGQSQAELQKNTIRSTALPGHFRKVTKIGATTGCTSGKTIVHWFNWSVMEKTCRIKALSKPDGTPLPKAPWAWAVESDGRTQFAAKGDSGSWIWNDRYEVIGMVWGGDDEGKFTYFTSMDWITRSISKSVPNQCNP